MFNTPWLYIIINWIFALEYLMLGIVLLIDVIKMKRSNVQFQHLQIILYSLSSVLIPLRVIEEIIYFSLDSIYRGLLICSGYWIYFCLFTLTAYSWYSQHRLNIYTFNLFHLPLDNKLQITKIGRLAGIVITALALLALIIIIYFVVHGLNQRFDADDISIGFRLYHLVMILINFVMLLCMGSLLLWQLNKYFTERPRKLIAYLYFNIFALMIGGITITLFISIPRVFLEFLRYDIYSLPCVILYINVLEILPLYFFHILLKTNKAANSIVIVNFSLFDNIASNLE